MSYAPLLYDRLLQELPKHKHLKDALMASGFKESTSRKNPKKVLEAALRYHARRLIASTQTPTATGRQLMSELVGLTSHDVFGALKRIATQERDLGSALKVLGPLAKEHGVVLDPDEEPKKAPSVINVIVERNAGQVIDATVNSELDNDTNDESN